MRRLAAAARAGQHPDVTGRQNGARERAYSKPSNLPPWTTAKLASHASAVM
jgi:hypothetical protein